MPFPFSFRTSMGTLEALPVARVNRLRAVSVVLGLAMLLGACGGSSPPTPAPGNPDTGETITGRERIGWTQQARGAAELSTFDYAIYVDGNRRELEGEACTAAGGGEYNCAAPLPSLTPGQHTLELATFISTSGGTLESARSTALRVTVSAVSAPTEQAAARDATIVTSEGHRFRASIAARGLDDPSDLAIAPDGRVFVAERAGRVRVVGPEGLRDPAALELDGVAVSDEAGLTAIALHPDFDRNGYVYLAYTIEGRDGPVFRIARFRERNGIFAQSAVIAREPAPAAQAHAVARFGADGRLYAGFAVGLDPRDAQNAATALGKILRLNDDGTTPRDNPRASATFSSGHRDPRAFAWHPTTGKMWEVERDREAGDEVNAIVPGADYGWPLARGLSSYARSVPAALVLPAGTDVSGACFVPVESNSPLAGELLVASRGAEDLLRIRAGVEGQQPGLIAGMLQRRYGRIAAVTVSADGTIYIATTNRDTWGAGLDVLIRLSGV